ncbi:MAG TPA: hypothetical protein PK177_22905, partial [Burkholderiaceae bacterium]|nr:hypothetical protein [Burkholderiaceae bacterium]
MAACLWLPALAIGSQVDDEELRPTDGPRPTIRAQWRGAASEGGRGALAPLAEAGAEVVRLYDVSDTTVLDHAHTLGLRVIAGLPVGHPRHGFRLDDPAALQAQEERIRAIVKPLRTHPAVLAWAV